MQSRDCQDSATTALVELRRYENATDPLPRFFRYQIAHVSRYLSDSLSLGETALQFDDNERPSGVLSKDINVAAIDRSFSTAVDNCQSRLELLNLDLRKLSCRCRSSSNCLPSFFSFRASAASWRAASCGNLEFSSFVTEPLVTTDSGLEIVEYVIRVAVNVQRRWIWLTSLLSARE